MSGSASKWAVTAEALGAAFATNGAGVLQDGSIINPYGSCQACFDAGNSQITLLGADTAPLDTAASGCSVTGFGSSRSLNQLLSIISAQPLFLLNLALNQIVGSGSNVTDCSGCDIAEPDITVPSLLLNGCQVFYGAGAAHFTIGSGTFRNTTFQGTTFTIDGGPALTMDDASERSLFLAGAIVQSGILITSLGALGNALVLNNAAQTIGFTRRGVLPRTTLTADRVYTLNLAGTGAGDVLTVDSYNQSGHTATFHAGTDLAVDASAAGARRYRFRVTVAATTAVLDSKEILAT